MSSLLHNFVKTLIISVSLLLSQGLFAYSELVIFGDSLSDTGNAIPVSALPFPFYQNRISNGPLAVDHLANHLGLSAVRSHHLLGNITGSNYSVVGGNALGEKPEDLNAQVSAYLNYVRHQANPSALFVIAIGGNDIRTIRSLDVATKQLEQIADRIHSNASRLLSHGVTTLLISNIPNVGRTPETLNDGFAQNATAHTINLNQKIARLVEKLQANHSADIKLFDFYAYFNNLLDQASSLGFSYTTVGCYTFPFEFHSACKMGLNFDLFVFFDSIHPSAKTHELLGKGLISALNLSITPPLRPPNSAPSIAPVLLLLLE